MDIECIDSCLLACPGASKALHASWGWMVYWVAGKQFACELVVADTAKAPYAGRHLLSLKCDPDRIRELRAAWPDAVLPGYYSDGRTWISIDLDSSVPERTVLDLCRTSYDLVVAKLPKRVQRELLGA